KDVKCGDLRYGRQYYDYQEGTLVFLAPGQVVEVGNRDQAVQPKGWGLLFHPDLLKGTSLGRMMKNYTFFSYESNEALHLSDQERQVVFECLGNIEAELHRGIDKHSKMLITSNIELLLNYCLRFYDRQFITRENVNKDILIRFEELIDDYFQSGKPMNTGLLTVGYCADRLHLSANYFGDLIKKETGRTAQEHIQMKLMDIAKEKVLDPSKTISEISYELGFQYPQHFTRLFKRCVGCTPNEYRTVN
ncbi:MAG: AraC family transcriptional regulator, partial [Odoribacter splanchnicus]|nr:AraC family transcriptional regulator [Odoribacter splanchnicus]